MPEVSLITTITIGFVLAYLLGMLCLRFKVTQIVGYLIAGLLVGPFTPGFQSNIELSKELSEIGVILLMFGVGLHFSPKDLISVKALALPATFCPLLLGLVVGFILHYCYAISIMGGVLCGIAITIASTVVAIRNLEQRQLFDSNIGKVTVGCLILEDLIVILVLVFLPMIAELQTMEHIDFMSIVWSLVYTISMVILFVLIMAIFGPKVIPKIIAKSAATGSEELFTLSVLVVSMGVAYVAVTIFHISFALGAFFAGMILSGSELSHRAAKDMLPLRDAFAVLFFVSVGMSFDPKIVLNRPFSIIFLTFVVVCLIPLVVYMFFRFIKKTRRFSLFVGVTLSTLGEFTFILTGLADNYQFFPPGLGDVILMVAILSILINPLTFKLAEKYVARFDENAPAITVPTQDEEPAKFVQEPVNLEKHIIIVGRGKFGGRLLVELEHKNVPLVVVDENKKNIEDLLSQNVPAILGDFKDSAILDLVNIDKADIVIYTIANIYEIASSVDNIKTLNPHIRTVAYAEHKDEIEYLLEHHVDEVIDGISQLASCTADVVSDLIIKEEAEKRLQAQSTYVHEATDHEENNNSEYDNTENLLYTDVQEEQGLEGKHNEKY